MLTDTKLRALKPRGKLYRVTDAKGLCVAIAPSGSRLWRFRYRHAGNARMVSLGAWPDVSLADARERRDEARKLVAKAPTPAPSARPPSKPRG